MLPTDASPYWSTLYKYQGSAKKFHLNRSRGISLFSYSSRFMSRNNRRHAPAPALPYCRNSCIDPPRFRHVANVPECEGMQGPSHAKGRLRVIKSLADPREENLLRRSKLPFAVYVLTCVAWLDICVCSHAASKPNFLLVTMDTTRRDHLGCYGYSRPTPPTDLPATTGPCSLRKT